MAQEILTYSDFSAGDWGRIGPEKAPKNSFSGVNVLVFRTGELGVRGGVRNVTPTGQVNGDVWGVGERPLSPGGIWYGQGTAIKQFSLPGDAVTTATGSLTGAPGSVFVDETGATVYLCTANANGYSYNGTTITSLNNMPNAQAIAQYGQRLAIVPISAQNTVIFSADSSFNNWTIAAGSAVSVTVGDTDQITALFAQRSHLAVMKRDSALFVITGTPGTNEALRQVYRFNGPPVQRTAGRTRSDDRIWFAPNNSQVLASFDGANVELLDNVPIIGSGGATSRRGIKTFRDDDQAGLFALVPNDSPSSNELWLRHRGVWTRHTFGVTLSNYAAVTRYGYPQDGDSDADDIRQSTCLVLTDGGGAAATPVFYSWQPFMDRPGLEAEPFGASTSVERAGDNSAAAVVGSFNLPHFADERGRELQVQRVRVDFRSWNNGASDNTRFDLTVRSIREYDGTYVDSAAQTWEDAPGNSSLAGTYRRKEFSFGDQGFGSGLQLRFANMRGVAIRRIVVTYDTRSAR